MPYLHRLGISHLYLSPIFAATPGSTHGYDVLDHNQVNPELGGLSALYALGEELRSRDMGLILDIVPNHVGIALGANPWWRDVLRYGQASKYAGYFDIDWEGHPEMPAGVLVYPILGKPFGQALELGELQLELEDGDVVLRYFDHSLPLAPRSYPGLLGLPPMELREAVRDPAVFSSLVEVVDALPSAPLEQATQLLDRLRFAMADPAIADYVAQTIRSVNGVPGDQASFDRLEALLSLQHYRLTYWRVSGEALNYRRFFDINDLPAIRVEREDVFEEVHRLLFELVARGIVTGVRVDHIDGLYDPAEYVRRLRAGLGSAAGADGHTPSVYVEKILDAHESLPPDWEVEGTTGYEFASRVDGLFVDREAEREMSDIHIRFTGAGPRYREIAYLSRRQVAETSFAGEINVLAVQLHRLAQRHRLHRDNTLRSLREAIATTLACFPVYRTYVIHGRPAEGDRATIQRAIAEARARDPALSEEALEFLAEVLLLEGALSPEEHQRRLHYRRRFQQVSGPIVAKGVEDTAFYRYTRLISLNEVGGDPSRFGTPVPEVHEWLRSRAASWPHAMSASSTHDSKRSEDLRARIHVLSEIPRRWRAEVRAWARANRRHKVMVEGELMPDANTEYYLYQTLAGLWPSSAADLDELRRRMGEHAHKAIREAKVYTSWLSAGERYEAACADFVEAILDSRRSAHFLGRLTAFAASIDGAAAYNSLSALILKVLAPGFPDFYQGCEATCRSLTDPDNRRAADFTGLCREVDEDSAPALSDLGAPAAKLRLTRRLLAIRERHASLLATASYEPLEVTGARAANVFAFVRQTGDTCLVVALPRLTTRLLGEGATIAPQAWQDTSVELPGDVGDWRDELQDLPVQIEGSLRLRDAPGGLPFVVLGGRRQR